MRATDLPRATRRAVAIAVVGSCALLAGCSGDDDDRPGGTSPDTIEADETLDQAPGASNDVSDGSGEGGNRSDD